MEKSYIGKLYGQEVQKNWHLENKLKEYQKLLIQMYGQTIAEEFEISIDKKVDIFEAECRSC